MHRPYTGHVPFVRHQEVSAGDGWQGTFDHHLFSVTVSGGATYQFNDGVETVEVGDLLHFAPSAYQQWQADVSQGWTVYFLITDLSPHLTELLPPDNLAPGTGRMRLNTKELSAITNCFSIMEEWSAGGAALSDAVIANQLEYALLLVRAHHTVSGGDPRIERAREFLHARLDKPTTLDEVAEAAALSRARLCVLFKEAFDTTPLQYLEALRMERAAQLLRFTATEIDRIAASLCYGERKYFDKRFKRRWQATPYQYRKQGNSG